MQAIDIISGNEKIRRPMLADLKRVYWKVAKAKKKKDILTKNEQTCEKCRDYGWVEILRAGKSAFDCPIQLRGRVVPALYVSRGIIPCLCPVGISANDRSSVKVEYDVLRKLHDRAAYHMGGDLIYETSKKCMELGRKLREEVEEKIEEPEFNDIPF